ncbi:hypothetical protein Tco_0292105 [Tanacetum coccineum]
MFRDELPDVTAQLKFMSLTSQRTTRQERVLKTWPAWNAFFRMKRMAMWEGGEIINYDREPQNTYARPSEDGLRENENQEFLHSRSFAAKGNYRSGIQFFQARVCFLLLFRRYPKICTLDCCPPDVTAATKPSTALGHLQTKRSNVLLLIDDIGTEKWLLKILYRLDHPNSTV